MSKVRPPKQLRAQVNAVTVAPDVELESIDAEVHDLDAAVLAEVTGHTKFNMRPGDDGLSNIYMKTLRVGALDEDASRWALMRRVQSITPVRWSSAGGEPRLVVRLVALARFD